MACLIGGLAWCVGSSGTHHLLYAPMDWQIRDAVMRDLALGPWPVGYVVGDAVWLLRAPLGYYMPAALAGRIGGLGVAQAALFVWTALGLALVLALLAALARQAGVRARWLVLVFLTFGGLDLLPNIWLDLTDGTGLASYWGRGGEWWARIFQYSGHVTLLLWVPNHALAAWIPALLLLRHARRPEFLRVVAVPLAAAAAWSPLGALGAGLMAGVVALSGGFWRAALIGPANWLGVALAVPLAWFLTAGSSEIPHAALVAQHGLGVLPRLALFLAIEFGVIAAATLLVLRSRLLESGLVMLALLPLYMFGPGNEMTMRTGMAPLAVLAVAAGCAVQLAAEWRRRLLAGLLLVAAVGQGMEASALSHAAWAPSRDCSLPEAAAQSVFNATNWSHYVVHWPEAALRRLIAPPVMRSIIPGAIGRCWP
ncbi:hypothetical protein [Falsiroseomonas sp. E2-1-a4]|uniref:hypothetical protein n=1 Tax=Falsiroseomonas sp. E2-1-a4 TaxID=3239299 RepID=UPI003F2D5609